MRDVFRLWRSNLLSTLVAIATLLLAVGATTAILGIVHSVLMKPLPFLESDRLVTVFLRDENPARGKRVSPPNVREWQDRLWPSYRCCPRICRGSTRSHSTGG